MKIAIAFAAMIVLTATANLLLKTGAMQGTAGGTPWLALLNWRVFAGVGSFGAAAFVYVLVLRWLPLSVAQSFAAAQFIATVLASVIFLQERISPGQWIGIFLIAFGIATVAWFSE